jgi:hypothetical protein
MNIFFKSFPLVVYSHLEYGFPHRYDFYLHLYKTSYPCYA